MQTSQSKYDILWKHSPRPTQLCDLWLLSPFNAELSSRNRNCPAKPRIFTICPLHKKFATPYYGAGEDPWESIGLQGGPTSPSWRKSILGVHWKDWCWRWNSNILATWCEELTHLKRPWCWERLRAGGEGDDWRWDGWMASPTQWTWVWVNSGSWWWTGRPGMLQFMGSQRVKHNWAAELNWTELNWRGI